MLTRIQQEDSIISSWLFDSVWIQYTVQIANWMWETKIPIITSGLGRFTVSHALRLQIRHERNTTNVFTSLTMILNIPNVDPWDPWWRLLPPPGSCWGHHHRPALAPVTHWLGPAVSLCRSRSQSPLSPLSPLSALAPRHPFNWDSGAWTPPATLTHHNQRDQMEGQPDRQAQLDWQLLRLPYTCGEDLNNFCIHC